MLTMFPATWVTIYATAEWTIRVVMVIVILRRRLPPVTALAWLSIIFFLPVVGLPLYLLFGKDHLGRKRRAAHRRFYGQSARSQLAERRRAAVLPHRLRPDLDPGARNMLIQAEQVSGNPIVGGNTLELLPDTAGFIDRLVGDIDAAAHHAHVLFYIYHPDEPGRRVSEALLRAAGRGVACRLLADAAGSRRFFGNAMCRRLREAGVEVVEALPVAPWRRKLARMDLRNHRKVVVIDGRVGYTGSHNIIDEGYGHKRAGKWVDLSARFTGPVVGQLQHVFLDDWEFDTGARLEEGPLFPPTPPDATPGNVAAQVVPTGPNHEAETFRRVLIAALGAANEQITITTPYLVPDEPTTLALAMAADRGVAVTILVPERGDHPLVAAAGRWHFEKLLENGIEIHHYVGGMLHAKTITVDDSFGLLGSANIDVRSFELNFEANVLLYGREVTQRLRQVQRRYLERCRIIHLADWKRRPILRQYTDAAAALLSPLL